MKNKLRLIHNIVVGILCYGIAIYGIVMSFIDEEVFDRVGINLVYIIMGTIMFGILALPEQKKDKESEN